MLEILINILHINMARGSILLTSLFLICMVAVESQSVDNATALPTEATPTDYVCRLCQCQSGRVDCTEQNIEAYFSVGDWLGLKETKPTSIDLSNNALTRVTKMAELPVVTLNLSHNAIDAIDRASFMDLQQLQKLDLSWNRLTAASLSPHAFEGRYSPEQYEPLSAMRHLSLAHNQLHSLNQDLFEHLALLQQLDLEGNPLQVLDHVTVIAVSSLQMLQVLNLRDCQLSSLPAHLLHTPKDLERLDLSRNQLETVPQELEEARSLKWLSLNQNPIEKLDNGDKDHLGFPTLPKLEELHMCNMPALTSVGEGSLSGLRGLRVLHLSHNPGLRWLHPKALARVDDAGEGYDWPMLSELYLRSNNLSEVDRRLVSRWELLDALDLADNPYLCDCSTQWMVDVLVGVVEAKAANASVNMVCQEPIEMRGFTMQHLHNSHRSMRCVDKYGNRPERDGAMLLGTLIGVLLAVPMMLGLVLLWRRGCFAWLGLRGPSGAPRAFYKRAPLTDDMHI